MRTWFHRLPIHQKLVTSALFITAVALMVATLGLILFDVWRYRATAAEDAQALASVLAENAAAAVVFNQSDAAEEILRSVRVRNVVTRVCVFLPTGELFAGFSATGAACPGVPPPDDAWAGVSGQAPILRNGRVYGSVHVERNLSDLRGRVLLTALAAVVMFAFAASAAYVLAARVNATISRPIAALAEFARNFGDATSRTPPAIRTSPDELGALVTAFDDMVARVHDATDELTRSNAELRHEQQEREAAGARERESDRRFRMLADGSPVLLWVNGPDGCEFVNRAYLQFIGLDDAASVRGYDWSRFVHPDDREGYLGTYKDAYARRSAFTAEFRFSRADGEWRWMRSEATPRIEGGVFAGFVGATVDITERRRAEQALRDADQRKDNFLAILAHELRNPLAPIRTGLELLRVGGDKPVVAERIRPVLERQVAHVVRLIDDLLDVSRISSGKVQLKRQPTALEDLVHSAVEANRAAIEAAGLHLSVDIPDAPCILDVDPTRFVQVLSNLLHNATKFTDRGGSIALTATIDEQASPPMLTVRIADSGVGIAPPMLPLIFDLFVQGAGPRGARSGLGIGLALVKQLVEMHGGRIEAQSAGENEGSAFTIRLPVVGLEQPPQEAPRPEARRLTGRRVLVIDDNVDAADMLATLVGAIGGTARAAYDGPTGLRTAAEFRPDAILLDIGMAGMDGYETCRRLRADPATRSAFIVAVTGWGQPQDRDRALSEGFDAHLTKPADPLRIEELLADAPAGSVRSHTT